MSIYVEVSYFDVTKADKRVLVGEEPVHDSQFDTLQELFRVCVKAYGRCVSRVYVDDTYGKLSHQIGWVFEKKVPYEDDPKNKWKREVWVTTLASAPVEKTEVTREYLCQGNKTFKQVTHLTRVLE